MSRPNVNASREAHDSNDAEQLVGGNGNAGRDDNYETAGQQSRDHTPSAYKLPPDSGVATTGGEQLANLDPQASLSQLHSSAPHRGNKAEPSAVLPPPSTNTNTPPAMPSTSPPSESKIFVGGLSWETNEGSLRRYFETFGQVLDCVIMRDRNTGHPRGFGFVTFADDAVAGRAASRRHDLDGRQVEAKRAVPRNEFGGGGMSGTHATQVQQAAGMGASNPSYGVRAGAQNYGRPAESGYGGMGNSSASMRNHHTTKCKVFVGGLPSSCGTEEFKGYFQTFGEVVDAQVMIDHNTGNSRGFGFVTFASEATVEQVVGPGRSNTRHEIMGKNVEVKRAEPKGANNERSRHRDNYGAGIGGNMRGGAGANSSNIGGSSDAGSNAATAAAAAYYSNYPGASLAEQYGAYYNNPQWQQYYAAMGYNFNAYPQGYNPYTYLQAYMNNVANGSNTGTATMPANDASAPGAAGATSATAGGSGATGAAAAAAPGDVQGKFEQSFFGAAIIAWRASMLWCFFLRGA